MRVHCVLVLDKGAGFPKQKTYNLNRETAEAAEAAFETINEAVNCAVQKLTQPKGKEKPCGCPDE